MSRDINTPPRALRTSRSAKLTPISSKWSKIQDKFHQYSSALNKDDSMNSSPILGAPLIPNEARASPHKSSFSTSRTDSPPSALRQNKSSFSIDHHHANTSPIQPPSIQRSANSFASTRTTSLPRTLSPAPAADSLSTPTRSTPPEQFEYSTPPVVEPYFSKNSTPKNRKVLINMKCCFCDELLSSKLSTEKVIELNCGDNCHEECLWLLLNHEDQLSEDPYSIFPKCEKCYKTAIPIEETITDSFISRFLLSSPPRNMTNSDSSDSLIISSNYEMPPVPYYHNQQQYNMRSPLSGSPSSHVSLDPTSSKFQALSLSSKNSKDLSIHIPDRPLNRITHYPLPPRINNGKSKSRGSSISAISSIVSSVPKSPSPTQSAFGTINSSITLSDQNKLSLAIARSEYVEKLVKKLQENFNASITEADIDSFGLLRLVDELLVSHTGESFKDLIVYLFQYRIVLVNRTYSSMLTYDLSSQPKIKTPNSSILKISFSDSKSLYLSQKSSSILQKWIAGLCDNEFVFDATSLSSTVDKNSDLKSSSGAEVEDEVDDQITIPVLLSPLNVSDSSKVTTPMTEKPLSYFNKTDHLILIVDHEKALSEQSITTLTNISKVLFHQFQALKMIYTTNSFSTVHSFGDFDSVIDQIGITSNKSAKPINEVIEEILDGASDEYFILVLSNCLSSTSLRDLPSTNQLIVQVQANGSRLERNTNNHYFVDAWEKIMEKLMPKLDLSFGGLFQDDIDSEFKDFDSSDFDSEFDSDIEGGFEDDVDDDDAKEDSKDKSSDESLNSDDIERFEGNSSTGESSPMLNLETGKLHSNQVEAWADHKPLRWSTLFKDIDEALMETTQHLPTTGNEYNDKSSKI